MPEKQMLRPYPLAGYKTIILPEEGVALILELAVLADGKDTENREVLMTSMKLSQARQLGEHLLKLSNTPDVRDSKGQA